MTLLEALFVAFGLFVAGLVLGQGIERRREPTQCVCKSEASAASEWKLWRGTNTVTGQDLGVYAGKTWGDAFRDMAELYAFRGKEWAQPMENVQFTEVTK